MKAFETHPGKILEGNNQFVVPLFPKLSTWNESRWTVLWTGLVKLCAAGTDSRRARPHFKGFIITVPKRTVTEAMIKFLLMDVQQRKPRRSLKPKPKALRPAKSGDGGTSRAVMGRHKATLRELVGMIQAARGRAWLLNQLSAQSPSAAGRFAFIGVFSRLKPDPS